MTGLPCRAGVIAALIALPLVAARPVAADPCTGYTAQLEGVDVISMGGITMTNTQRLVLRKRDGGGLVGAWTGIEHEQISHNSMAMLPEAMSALKSTPVQVVPGVDATCETTVPDAHTVRIRCVGQYPFEIRPGGGVYWQDRPTLIGTVAATKADPPIGITMDLLMGSPGYSDQSIVDGTMTGKIYGPGQYGFEARIAATEVFDIDDPYSEVQVNVWTQPEHDDAAISLHASAAFSGTGEAPFWAVNATRNNVRLNARFHGDPAKRAALAAATTIRAAVTIDGCELAQSWNLGDLALRDAVAP